MNLNINIFNIISMEWPMPILNMNLSNILRQRNTSSLYFIIPTESHMIIHTKLDDFTLYVPLIHFPPDMSQSLTNFRMNMTSSSHTPSVETASEDNYSPKFPP